MLVFISGSINSGKTTVSKALAQRLGAAFVNVDDLTDQIAGFNLETDLDKSMDFAIRTINDHLAQGKDVVANYVISENDWERINEEVGTTSQFFITLAPRLEVAQSQRGNRILSEWEKSRIEYHYSIGIASPSFGHRIDNSDLTVEQTVDGIFAIISR